jgi:hypothetical protein
MDLTGQLSNLPEPRLNAAENVEVLQAGNRTFAADAGFAGVGHSSPRIETESPEVIMLREAERTSGDEWAVLGSNQ